MTQPIELIGYVEEWFRRLREPALGHVTDAGNLTVSPDGRRVAFTARVPLAVTAEPARRVAVLDLADAALRVHEAESYRPCWSPDGNRLAWIADQDGRTTVEFGRPHTLTVEATIDVPGTLEYLSWSPDGGSLLLGVAEAGAERSDVYGSGRLPGDDGPSWAPSVSSGEPDTGARRAWLLDIAAGTLRCVPAAGTVWQAAFAGPATLIAVISDGPGESDWYGAGLALVDTASGTATPLITPDEQLAHPAASPSGRRLSVLAGAMSDRGLDAGRLLLYPDVSRPPRVVDTAGDATDHHWLDDSRLVFAGLRGLDTVVGLHDADTGETSILWSTSETCGDLMPEVAADGGTVAAVVHAYRRPPAIARLVDSRAEVCLDLAHPAAAVPGRLERLEWAAGDGRTIHGLLAVPDGPGPHPLVVHVHGGPVWAWRNAWSMHFPYTPLLVGRGYAVLHANARGSVGHGQEFVRAGLQHMGERDATDLLDGLDALVAAGRVDPARIGVTGNSYGGFMAAWLAATSDRFAAAVARSPVTDWVSQHHASNLPGFDRRCLAGDPLDPASDYRTRSPLYRAADIRTPMLLMAGARDLATPPEQAAMLHRALVERGRASTLVVYPEEGHGVRHHPALVDQCARMLAFFETYMPASSTMHT